MLVRCLRLLVCEALRLEKEQEKVHRLELRNVEKGVINTLHTLADLGIS